MSVDFISLPRPMPLPPRPHLTRWFWLLPLFVTVGFGLTWWLWPRSAQPDMAEFWKISLLAPALLWGVVLCVRLWLDASAQERTERHNDHVAALSAGMRDRAAQSLQVLASGFLLGAQSGDDYADLAAGKQIGSSHYDPVQRQVLRYTPLELEMQVASDGTLDERFRETCLLLLSGIRRTVVKAAGTMRMQVILHTDTPAETLHKSATQHWREASAFARLPDFPIVLKTAVDWMLIDQWLNRPRHEDDADAILIVSISLTAAPVPDRAEAASALLLTRTIRETVPLASMARIHRPVASANPEAHANGAPLTAVRWSGVAAKSIGGIWTAHLDTAADAAVSADAHTHLPQVSDRPETLRDLDLMAGNAGTATPWLLATIAVSEAEKTNHAQLLVTLSKGAVIGMVVAPDTQA